MRLSGIVAVLAVAAFGLIGPTGAAAKSPSKSKSTSTQSTPKPCKDRSFVPKKASHMPRLQKSIRCLVNRERAKRDIHNLKQNRLLQRSADWQAQDMFEHHYFAHERPLGPLFADRVTDFGYGDTSTNFEVGENIGWSSTAIATPEKMVKLWMESPPHREILLAKEYRDQAVSAMFVAQALPGDFAASGGPFVIFVNQFGWTDKAAARKRP